MITRFLICLLCVLFITKLSIVCVLLSLVILRVGCGICMGNCCSPGCRLWCLWWCLLVLSFFPWDVLDEILNLIQLLRVVLPAFGCICSLSLPFLLLCLGRWKVLQSLIFDCLYLSISYVFIFCLVREESKELLQIFWNPYFLYWKKENNKLVCAFEVLVELKTGFPYSTPM